MKSNDEQELAMKGNDERGERMRGVEKQLICLALSADKSSPRITHILSNRFPINYLG